MSSSHTWRLKRYGRFDPGSGEKGENPWKVFEANDNKPEIVLSFVECGYLVVLQGQECLDRIPLLWASDTLKVCQKEDNLMFRFTAKGEGRMMRMQFYGSSKTVAMNSCLRAVEKLIEYIPVTTQASALPPPNQSPAEGSAPVTQTRQEKAMEEEPGAVQGSVTIERLTQHFLGENAETLPDIYRHGCLAQGDFGPILRACLLDPTFPAFVQKVEEELKKLVEE